MPQTMTASEMTSHAHDPPVAQLGKRGFLERRARRSAAVVVHGNLAGRALAEHRGDGVLG